MIHEKKADAIFGNLDDNLDAKHSCNLSVRRLHEEKNADLKIDGCD